MNIEEKLKILADGAKYDASCSSSGVRRKNSNGLGVATKSGICHSYSSDGRCISLLKILMTNCCIFDCKYCINRKTNKTKRAIFTPKEIAELTINFYKRNYIEGLFLSSGIIKSPDYTMEKLIETISLLRNKYHFHGYIHVKAIPGSSKYLLKKLGSLVDRMSTNIELPTKESLHLLAPDKNETKIGSIMKTIKENKNKNFVPAGQSTQLIIGATKDSDYQIMKQSSIMYQNYHLKRVFYSAYISVNQDKLLPTLKVAPLLREHRLYEADWLIRYYGFKYSDLLDEYNTNFNVLIDPKANWAIKHLNEFPKEVNKVSYNELLKVPGIGPKSARRIIKSRRFYTLNIDDLKKMGVVIKRAKYFILCNGKYFIEKEYFKEKFILANLLLEDRKQEQNNNTQLRLFLE